MIKVGGLTKKKRIRIKRDKKLYINLKTNSYMPKELTCYYHPEIEADAKCDKCGKIICLECVKNFNTHIRGSNSSYYSSRHQYCIPCYIDIEGKRLAGLSFRKGTISLIIAFTVSVILLLIPLSIGILWEPDSSYSNRVFYSGQMNSKRFLMFIPIILIIILSISAVLIMIFRIQYYKVKHPIKIAEVKKKREDFFKTVTNPKV